jgi:hypothetical protein
LSSGPAPTKLFGNPPAELDLFQVREVDQADVQGVVQVVRVIGEAVGRVHHLGFEQGLTASQEVPDFRAVRAFAVIGLRLQHLPRQV